MFTIGFLLTRTDFSVIWRYFAWSNQTLGMVFLWTVTVYLVQKNKFFWVSLIPAVFMTAVITTYLFYAPEGFSLSMNISYAIGIIASFSALTGFFIYRNNWLKKQAQLNNGTDTSNLIAEKVGI
jgi:carbon starvation protein CstA